MTTAVATIDEFLALVRKSGLVAEERLAAACADWTDRSQPLPDALVRKLVDESLLTQWQVDQLRKGKHRGFTLGNYRLLQELGAGGMSRVFLAEHVHLHGKVAIKVLPRDNVGKTSYLARFEQEAREAFRLRDHPNIVRATDSGTSGTIHYFVMDYVEGIDLHAKVKRDGPLPIHDAVDYVRQAALGLQYAHEEGVVHRDIKPANLMLDKRGTVKILDFGLALAGDDDGSLTREYDEKILGTADYLAPEQAVDSHKADARSDIYSLGCTLYYLLVGKVPFAGAKLADRILAHQKQPRPNPLDVRSDVPAEIVELYFRMMEKHPSARPQTAREVADVLDAWLKSAAGTRSGGAGATPLSPPRRAPGTASNSGVWPAVPRGPTSGIARQSGSSIISRSSKVTPSNAGSTTGRGGVAVGPPGRAPAAGHADAEPAARPGSWLKTAAASARETCRKAPVWVWGIVIGCALILGIIGGLTWGGGRSPAHREPSSTESATRGDVDTAVRSAGQR